MSVKANSLMSYEISLLPFEGTSKKDLDCLVQDLASIGIDASMLSEVTIPNQVYDPQRQQYNASILLRYVHEQANHQRILGVTDMDLYVEGLNFVFGVAESPGRVAVISLYRLSMGVDAFIFRERAVKEAVHELGHTFGLGHCPDSSCVMHFSNCLDDTDRKGKEYCPECRAKLRE
jgi:archaemetzincin